MCCNESLTNILKYIMHNSDELNYIAVLHTQYYPEYPQTKLVSTYLLQHKKQKRKLGESLNTL